MKFYIIDAFTETVFGGNPAGVVLCGGETPGEAFMQGLAAELGYSETAFITEKDGGFSALYYTPVAQVELCGHATIASFCALGHAGMVQPGGRYKLDTLAGKLNIDVESDSVWMDMSEPISIGHLEREDIKSLYAAYGLDAFSIPEGLLPEVISTGLPDIMMPVRPEALPRMLQHRDEVCALSKKYGVTGVHAFALDVEFTARCRNFAPLYGIDEEAATGTSNGALTYYLYRRGLIKAGQVNRFRQGEAMHRPSLILSAITESAEGEHKVRVGGGGVILVKGEI